MKNTPGRWPGVFFMGAVLPFLLWKQCQHRGFLLQKQFFAIGLRLLQNANRLFRFPEQMQIELLVAFRHILSLICIRISKQFLNMFYLIKTEYNMQEKGGGLMEPFVVKKQEKEVISMRLPLDTLREIDYRATQAGVSRNELLNQMIAYALAYFKDPEK